MKKNLRNYILINICFLLSSTGAIADDAGQTRREHNFSIGMETMHFNYEEDLMEEDGLLYGLIAGYTYHDDNNMMFNTTIEYLKGDNLDYDGQTWGGDPIKRDTKDWIVEWCSLVGYEYKIKGKYLITPFIGLAYRHWNDNVSGSGSYERKTKYLYSPIGIQTVAPLFGKWSWGISAEYDLLWRGRVKSQLSDAYSGYNDPEVEQDFGDGYGLRFSLSLTRSFAGKYAISIQPYIRYWKVEDSDKEMLTWAQDDGLYYTYVLEPKNETKCYGLRLSIFF